MHLLASVVEDVAFAVIRAFLHSHGILDAQGLFENVQGWAEEEYGSIHRLRLRIITKKMQLTGKGCR
jgi:hypothetical protein